MKKLSETLFACKKSQKFHLLHQLVKAGVANDKKGKVLSEVKNFPKWKKNSKQQQEVVGVRNFPSRVSREKLSPFRKKVENFSSFSTRRAEKATKKLISKNFPFDDFGKVSLPRQFCRCYRSSSSGGNETSHCFPYIRFMYSDVTSGKNVQRVLSPIQQHRVVIEISVFHHRPSSHWTQIVNLIELRIASVSIAKE